MLHSPVTLLDIQSLFFFPKEALLFSSPIRLHFIIPLTRTGTRPLKQRHVTHLQTCAKRMMWEKWSVAASLRIWQPFILPVSCPQAYTPYRRAHPCKNTSLCENICICKWQIVTHMHNCLKSMFQLACMSTHLYPIIFLWKNTRCKCNTRVWYQLMPDGNCHKKKSNLWINSYVCKVFWLYNFGKSQLQWVRTIWKSREVEKVWESFGLIKVQQPRKEKWNIHYNVLLDRKGLVLLYQHIFQTHSTL